MGISVDHLGGGKKTKLTGNALVHAMQLAQVIDLHEAEQAKLDEEFDAKVAALEKEWEPRLNEIMQKLANEIGIDMEQIMEYRLDMTYLEEHGLAFLCEVPEGICPDCGGGLTDENTEQSL